MILYEMSCGKVPFDADNFMGILTQHMYKAPIPIRALVPPPENVPPGLEAIILKCLSKRSEQRYPSMRDLSLDLEKLAGGLVPDAVGEMMSRSGGFNVPNEFFKGHARMPAPVPATPSRAGKSQWPLFAGAAGVVAAVGMVVAIFTRSAASPASQPPASSGVALAAFDDHSRFRRQASRSLPGCGRPWLSRRSPRRRDFSGTGTVSGRAPSSWKWRTASRSSST